MDGTVDVGEVDRQPVRPDRRLVLPGAPALVVDPRGQRQRGERLRPHEGLVAPGVGHQAALVLVVRLAHEHQPPRAPGDDHTAGPSRGWPAATAGPQS